jgi:hypothetical protein
MAVHSAQRCWSTRYVTMQVWPQTRGIGSLHSAPLWALASEEKRTRSEVDPRREFPLALRVPVEAAKELLAQGMQKPPRRVGEKQFPSGFSAAPAAMVKKPACQKTRPTWKQLDRLGRLRPACLLHLGPAVSRTVWGCQAWRPQPCTP